MSKILIIGATGQTGIEVTKLALERNLNTSVFVRTPEKLGEIKKQVKVFEGDARNYEQLKPAIQDAEIIISVVGPTKNSPEGMQPTIAKNIVKAMQETNKSRLVALTGAGVRTEGDDPKLPDKLIRGLMQIVAKKALVEGESYVDIIKQTNLDWTIVRGPRLTNKEAKNKYEVGMVGADNMSTEISRKDLAKFILNIIEDKSTFQKMPMVSW